MRLLGYIDVVRFHSTTGREKVLEALGYAKRKGLVWDYLQCMHTMGQVEQALGDITEARRYFREVIRLSGEHGNRQYEREARTARSSSLSLVLPVSVFTRKANNLSEVSACLGDISQGLLDLSHRMHALQVVPDETFTLRIAERL